LGETEASFLTRHCSNKTLLTELPDFLKDIVHSNQAPAFNRLLIRTVLISSLANFAGSVGSGIRHDWHQQSLG
jgi:hypothetical protein